MTAKKLPPLSSRELLAKIGLDDLAHETLLFDESPELYLWLGSDGLAME